MRCGDFEGAWAASDRIRSRRIDSTLWDGTPLAGRRVLVHCNHGLGDTIQFIRYAAPLRAIACEVIVRAHAALLPILSTVRGIDRLYSETDVIPSASYDAQIEVMELGYIFRSTVDDVPREVPYVHVPAKRLDGGGVRAGVVWRSGPWDARRTMSFDDLRPLLALDGVSWHALQQDPLPHERHERLRPADTTEIVRTASAMRGLDLVLSIDSMPAHLAGALGVAVWTLLPYECDWRWLDHRADSPWYPTMRLFRQPAPGDWASVVGDVRRKLSALCLARPAHERREVRRLAVHQEANLENL
jgi:hypothetical protein